jgi:adenylate kinase
MALDIILLGGPGSGKGTQAEQLQSWLPLPHVSSGDLFRDAMESETELGKLVKEYVERGELVPDEITIRMVAERITRPDCDQGVILDGFPRTLNQARALDALFEQMDRRIDVVLNIEVEKQVLLERLSGRWVCGRCDRSYHRQNNPEQERGICDACDGELEQREDDRPETQRRRINVYEEQTAPLIRYYQEQGVLVDIDGDQEVDAVAQDIREAVEPLVKGTA